MNSKLKRIMNEFPNEFGHSTACDCEAESIWSTSLNIDIIVDECGELTLFCNSILQIRKTEHLSSREAIGIIKAVLSNQ